MADNILVRWIADDGGWREGVACAIYDSPDLSTDRNDIAEMISDWNEYPGATAIIWDRTRNERCIMRLFDVSMVEPRCSKCGGEGRIAEKINSYGDCHSWPCECRAKADQ